MKTSRFSDSQIIAVLKQAEAGTQVAASEDSLERLHSTIADKLTSAIEEMDADTKGLAALLNVARQFVEDNGIEAELVPGVGAGKLAEKLKEFPFDPAAGRC